MLAGPCTTFFSTAGANTSSLTECCCQHAAKAAAVQAEEILPQQTAATMSETERIYGAGCPVDVDHLLESPMLRAQKEQVEASMVVPLVARQKEVDKWPVETPPWAQIDMFTKHETVTSFVGEYLYGLDNKLPPLRDLEAKYGPDAVTKAYQSALSQHKSTKGSKATKPKKWKAWRASSTGRKEWCLRKPTYAYLDSHKGYEVQALTEYIQEHFQDELDRQGKTAGEPGKTILTKAMRTFQSAKEGFKERQDEAKKKRAKRKLASGKGDQDDGTDDQDLDEQDDEDEEQQLIGTTIVTQ
jgi:hypothetical protein